MKQKRTKTYLVSYNRGGKRLSDRVGPSKTKAVQVKNRYLKDKTKKNPRVWSN